LDYNIDKKQLFEDNNIYKELSFFKNRMFIKNRRGLRKTVSILVPLMILLTIVLFSSNVFSQEGDGVCEYNLTINSTQGGNVSVPGEGTFNYTNETIVNLNATTDSGYEFVNWTGDIETIYDKNSVETNITMNNAYNITANFNGTGSGGEGEDNGTCNITVSDGESIQEAVDNATNGDTICVEDGTYNETVKDFPITVNKSLTIKAADGASPVINASGQDAWAVISVEASDVILEGLTVKNGNKNDAPRVRGIHGNKDSDGLIIKNIIVDGVSVNISSSRPTAYGMTLSGNSTTVENTTVRNVEAPVFAAGIRLGGNESYLVGDGTLEGLDVNNINTSGTGQNAIGIYLVSISGYEETIVKDSSVTRITVPNSSNNSVAGIHVESNYKNATEPNISITENVIEGLDFDNATGVAVSIGNPMLKEISVSEIEVTNNKFFSNNLGMVNQVPIYMLNATRNFWGTTSFIKINNSIMGNVSFMPVCEDSGCERFVEEEEYEIRDISELVKRGIMNLSNNSNAVDVIKNITFTARDKEEERNNRIKISENTTMNRSDGGIVNLSELVSNIYKPEGNATMFEFDELGGRTTDRKIKWGLENASLDFSKPITIEFYVGNKSSEKLDIFRKSTDDWTQEGLVDTTCKVNEGYCVFKTNKASEFIALEQEEEEDTTTGGNDGSSGGGGSSGGSICTTEWNCTEWSDCVNGTQTRNCSYPERNCRPTEEKPEENRTCVPQPEEDDGVGEGEKETGEEFEENQTDLVDETNETTTQTSGFITGFVTGVKEGKAKNIFVLVVIVVVLGLIIHYRSSTVAGLSKRAEKLHKKADELSKEGKYDRSSKLRNKARMFQVRADKKSY